MNIPTRLLVAGDVHANAKWVGHLCKVARDHDCEAILQLGDFGYWPNDTAFGSFVGQVTDDALRAGLTIYWIDGNHEDHTALRDRRPAADGFVDISKTCRYIPRGCRWDWSGIRFGALGGAFSIDWRSRTPGVSWWPQEVTTDRDVEVLGAARVDVLVAHEAPAGVALLGARLPASDRARTDEVRALVREAVEATLPSLVLHGHWHLRHSSELSWPVENDGRLDWNHTQVEGLASDLQGDCRAWGILDLHPLRFRGGEQFDSEG